MKLQVISDSDSFYLGTIEAVVGMHLREGYKITKVNEKSIYFFNALVCQRPTLTQGYSVGL